MLVVLFVVEDAVGLQLVQEQVREHGLELQGGVVEPELPVPSLAFAPAAHRELGLWEPSMVHIFAIRKRLSVLLHDLWYLSGPEFEGES